MIASGLYRGDASLAPGSNTRTMTRQRAENENAGRNHRLRTRWSLVVPASAPAGNRERRAGAAEPRVRSRPDTGRGHRIDFKALTRSCVTVYGQTEITRDLFEARDAAGGVIVHEAEDVTPHDIETDAP